MQCNPQTMCCIYDRVVANGTETVVRTKTKIA